MKSCLRYVTLACLILALAMILRLTAETQTTTQTSQANNLTPQDCGVYVEISPYISRNVNDDQTAGSQPPESDHYEVWDINHHPSEHEVDLVPITITATAGPTGGTMTLSVIEGGDKINYTFWKDGEKQNAQQELSWTVSANASRTEILYVEGYANSSAPKDVKFQGSINCPAGIVNTINYAVGSATSTAETAVYEVDLDIDSNNNNGFEAAGYDDAEDQLEASDKIVDGQPRPGKIVLTTPNADTDGNGIPDFAELAIPGRKFVPVRVELKTPFDPTKTNVKFSYTDSPPVPGATNLAQGGMRLWQKDATSRTLLDFIPVNTDLQWITLAGSNRSLTLFLEYVDNAVPSADGRHTIFLTASEVDDPVILAASGGNTPPPPPTSEDEPKASDKVKVFLLPVEVKWKAFDGFDNVDDHIDPWTKNSNGKRVFPDYKNPDESTLRNKVDVIVTTSPALVGKTVKVKAFDIDDSTDETFDRIDPYNSNTAAVIDINKKAGNDNIIDYLGTARAGKFLSSGTVDTETAVGTVDENGETKFTLKIGMQPGSNYKVVVTEVDGHPFPAAQVTDPSLDTYLGPETIQTSKAPSSPMLTVWRKLWVENDSMGEKKSDGTVVGIPLDAYGNKLNDLHQTQQPPTVMSISYDSGTDLTKFGIPSPVDLSSFTDLENGRLKIGGAFHPVDSTSQTTINVPPLPGVPGYTYTREFVYMNGDHSSIPVNSGFRLYDDDDEGLSAPPLSRTDLVNDVMKNYYKPAFIDIVDAATEDPLKDHNPNKYVPFRANEFVHGLFTVANDAVDLTDRKELWICPLVACYQREQEVDLDPNTSAGDSEAAGLGETNKMSPYSAYEFSAVFVETCRDSVTELLRDFPDAPVSTELMIIAVSAHEMGHQPGPGDGDGEIAHTEEGLMTAGAAGNLFGPNALKFKAKSIKRFRISQRWSE